MDDISQKRNAVINAYKSVKWKNRVNKMPDDQVVAIYMRLKSQGKI